MSRYEALAPFYDGLTKDIDYTVFADFYEREFLRSGEKIETVLDLACGTGAVTCLLAQRGYEMIGVDASAEMLSFAAEKMKKAAPEADCLFVNQTMQELDLFGTVDAAVCCLDGMNYLSQRDLEKTFSRLRLFIRPGGVFIFDINSPEKLRSLDGQTFIDETDDVFLVWRAELSDTEKACLYGMDIFERRGAVWARSFEEHREYVHEKKDLTACLTVAGFEDICINAGEDIAETESLKGRIFFTSRRK